MLNRRRRDSNAAARVAAIRFEMLSRFLDDAQSFRGLDAVDVPDMHMRTTAGERVYLCVQGAMLVEAADHASAPSVEAIPKTIDQGEFVVSSTRAVFTGTKQVRQWLWSELVGIDHADDAPWTSIAVSNRHKTFGVRYDKEHQDEIRFSIELAVATAQGTREVLVHTLKDELSTARARLARPADASAHL